MAKSQEEAYDLARFNEPLDIRGTDIDPAVLSLARYHFNQAGIQDGIHWQRQDFRDFSNRYKYGYIITNPPYGHRLGEIKEAEQIYKDLRPILAPLDTWSYFILTSHKDFERLLDVKLLSGANYTTAVLNAITTSIWTAATKAGSIAFKNFRELSV